MSQGNRLEKTTRINLLFAFYEPLLTDKQQTFLKYYFHDDFSLGEIAAEFDISRQAVYEHIKRAEVVLENYEDKLGLLGKHETRVRVLDELKGFTAEAGLAQPDQERLMRLINQLRSLE
ncbi:putative DNA-binding protein [Paenibacillus spiritus]|uniref:UPF0122 protein F4V43_05235 n=1 Tax=Paenibacillus spiritus TaxID=2496557 RepID=A0A5J5GF10_9BACL|nr:MULTISPECIES: putative DNA-binding protein [Paenibacillus]KAA9006362.1 putative DNA-binding protein [Paenibacillus spiritus]